MQSLKELLGNITYNSKGSRKQMSPDKSESILKKKCLKYDVITFDVFDTLLKRDVMFPTDVFRLVERKFDRDHVGARSDFAQKRIKTEYVLRKSSLMPEVTLDEIYKEIAFPPEQAEVLKEMEIEMERSLLHVNFALKRVYDFCIEQNKKVYLISDMYLPLSFLNEILEKAGYKGYSKLYLSCEYRKTKISGELFRAFLKEENIDRKNVLHIGDSIYADVLGAVRAGIRSVHISKRVNHAIYMPVPKDDDDLTKRCLYAFTNTHEAAFGSRMESLGYELLGPLIYGYCTNLHGLPERKGRKIWFAARDMFLFVKAYRILYPEDDFEYIYLSRKSLRPIYTNAVGDLAKSGDAFPDKEYTLQQVLDYMGYGAEDVYISGLKDIEKNKYNGRCLSSYPEIKQALSSADIVKKEEKLAETGREYLEQKGLFSVPIILADVGWHGTTQLLLEKIRERFSQTVPILGCYLGCCSGTDKRIGKDSYIAWLFDELDDRPFMRGIVLLESMILAPHGSVTGYAKSNTGTVEPILEKADKISETVLEMQRGAMAFINDFHSSILSDLTDIGKEDVCAGFEKLETAPLKEELKAIGDLDYENFYRTKIAAPKSFVYYLAHPKRAYNDFMYAGWRTGFMYRLFKVRLPYGKLYDLGRRLWRKLKAKSNRNEEA